MNDIVTTTRNKTITRLTRTTNIVFIVSGLFILFSFFALFYNSQQKSCKIKELEANLKPDTTKKNSVKTITVVKIDTVYKVDTIYKSGSIVYKVDTIYKSGAIVYKHDTVAFKLGADVINLNQIGTDTKLEVRTSSFQNGNLKSYSYSFLSYGQDTTNLNKLVKQIQMLISKEGFR